MRSFLTFEIGRSDLIAKHQERARQRAAAFAATTTSQGRSAAANQGPLVAGAESLAKLQEETSTATAPNPPRSAPVTDMVMNIFRSRASTGVTADYRKRMQQKVSLGTAYVVHCTRVASPTSQSIHHRLKVNTQVHTLIRLIHNSQGHY